jgi:tricorn protease
MPAELLTGHDNLKIAVTFGHPGEPATNVVRVKPSTYARARELVAEATIRARRARVHKLSGGRIGYVYVAAMDNASFKRFESEVFSEGYGRDALIVDVRNNHGGFTADRMLSILCAPNHSYEVPRNGRPGYLMGYTTHPVFTRPIAVLCNADSGSNAEIFTHAVKTLKRGIVVGQTTGGAVIATNNRSILDFGDFRDAEFGWFVNGGIDMENNGAEPDLPVPLTPTDEVRGEDPQLDTAVKALLNDNSRKEQKK